MPTTLTPDIAIIGGGIAGLWLLNRLQSAGYDCVLLESDSLGGAQSIKSQGIIHGGTKYALMGSITPATQAISAMPQIWRDCLNGHGEVDLSGARVLSNHHYLWSAQTLAGKLATFFASKALAGKVNKSGASKTPPVFQHAQFKGTVYELDELVLDVPSVINSLSKPHHARLIKIEKDQMQFVMNTDGNVNYIELKNIETKITPRITVLAAGEGNEQLLCNTQSKQPKMQRRPLHMLMMKAPNLPPTYAHCLSGGAKPRLTITTHFTKDGQTVWYLGGDVAENGIEKSTTEQIEAGKKEITELLPWVDISNAQWASFHINRAEPATSQLLRPDTAFTQMHDNIITAWPTKLALSPSLSDQVINLLCGKNIAPSKNDSSITSATLPKPSVGEPIWEQLF